MTPEETLAEELAHRAVVKLEPFNNRLRRLERAYGRILLLHEVAAHERKQASIDRLAQAREQRP